MKSRSARPREDQTIASALLRSNEFYLIPLALVIGAVAGAIVTMMREIAQIAHVLIYDIPIDVRLSANAQVYPRVALIAPTMADFRSGSWSGHAVA